MTPNNPNIFGRYAAGVITCALALLIIRLLEIPLVLVLVLIPILAVVLAVILVSWVVAIGAWRERISLERELKGLCVRCGYDLRANSDICPECGMLIVRARNPVTGREITAAEREEIGWNEEEMF